MNVILLGGNGYIGKVATEYLLAKDKKIQIYVLSRSGKNQLINNRITNIAIDVRNKAAVMAVLPEKIDYIIDFVGGLNNDFIESEKINLAPATTMLEIANAYNVKAMGYIGGVLGPKSFTLMKKRVIEILNKSNTRLEIVEPTMVYGNGRNDKFTKMVPLFKFLGIFSAKMKPMLVTDVAKQLIDKLLD